jgi:glycosyltransferase involved in cell wall biosynthesis
VASLDDLRRRHASLSDDIARAEAAIAAVRASRTWRLLRALDGRRFDALSVIGRLRGRAARLRRHGPRGVSRLVRARPLGVNVAGYLSAESGMGEAARASLRSLGAAGVPVALNYVRSGTQRERDDSHSTFTNDNPHPFNLVHLNCDNMAAFWRDRGRGYFAGRYTIGFWFWELARFRAEWMSTFRYVDEVWVASGFGRDALVPHAPVPVTRIPLPVAVPEVTPIDRGELGLPADATAFLFVFDVSSQFERKNPIGVLRAFREARLGRRAVLVLKVTNAGFDEDAMARLRAESEGLPVILVEGHWDRPRVNGLLAACDCYVSLHRAEGFGLTLAEAMALGKPVIGTAYSGNLDFMTDENSYLVPYSTVELARDHGPYPAGFEWAEPDLAHAARLMRQVTDDPVRARAVGARAAADMVATRNPSATGAVVRARLEAIRGGRDT